jgi:hypothetical protein
MAPGASRCFALVLLVGCATAGRDNNIFDTTDSGIVVLGDADKLIDAARPIDARPIDAAPVPLTMTETTSLNVAQGNSFSCNAANITSGQNSYYRVFTLSDFQVTDIFHVNNVTFAVETAVGQGGTQPATINLGTYTGALGGTTLDTTQITPLTSAPISIPNSTGGTVSTPITADVAPGSSLIVEIRVPDGAATSDELFIGSNNGGETKPVYILATSCSINSPTTMASIAATNGLPEPDVVLTVTGTH